MFVSMARPSSVPPVVRPEGEREVPGGVVWGFGETQREKYGTREGENSGPLLGFKESYRYDRCSCGYKPGVNSWVTCWRCRSGVCSTGRSASSVSRVTRVVISVGRTGGGGGGSRGGGRRPLVPTPSFCPVLFVSVPGYARSPRWVASACVVYLCGSFSSRHVTRSNTLSVTWSGKHLDYIT